MRHALLTAALLLAAPLAAGCDRFADDDPVDLAPPAPAQSSLSYIKGKAEIAVGQSEPFRARVTPGADHYTWTVEGPGETPEDDDYLGDVIVTPLQDTRYVTVTGLEAGPVTIRAYAVAADGGTLAMAYRTITVVPRRGL